MVVADDGMATGATMRAAVEAVRAAGAATVVVAVPVASLEAQTPLQQLADAVFSLFIPGQFRAVGSYYRELPAGAGRRRRPAAGRPARLNRNAG